MGLVLAIIILKIRGWYYIRKSAEYLKKFPVIEGTKIIEGAGEEVFFPGDGNYKYGLLLLHGFSASPDEFRGLRKVLRENGIPFIAPRLSGFGLISPESLKNVVAADWLKDAHETYLHIKSRCENVDFIAHSMGGLLALLLLRESNPGKIILTAPYLMPKMNHQKYVALLHSPIIFFIFKQFRPVVTKSSPEESGDRIVYHTVPVEAIAELWTLSIEFQKSDLPVTPVKVYFGAEDNTIEDEAVRKILTDKKLDLTFSVYTKSGHNLLEDAEQEEVIEDILKELGIKGE